MKHKIEIEKKYFAQKILVYGAEGLSGQAITRLLLRLGANIILCDANKTKVLHKEIESRLNSAQIEDQRGNDPLQILESTDIHFIVTAPGVPLKQQFFTDAKKKGILVFGEVDLAYKIMQDYFKESMQATPLIVAITGTDGKSTTTALLCEMVEASTGWHCVATGNFGFPFSLFVLAIIGLSTSHNTSGLSDDFESEPFAEEFRKITMAGPKLIAVVENSSYQLELVDTYRPDISLFLNLAEDHMDRYDSLQDYFLAKMNISLHQRSQDLFLAPEKIMELISISKIKRKHRIKTLPTYVNLKDMIYYCGDELLSQKEFALRGQHNRLNLEAALLCLQDLSERFLVEVNRIDLVELLKNFKGLAHRTELVGTKNNIEFINDSKATTVQSVVTAVSCHHGKKIFLLIGGRAKDTDFGPLLDLKNDFDLEYFTFGESKNKLMEILDSKNTYENLEGAFSSALKKAQEYAKSGKPCVVLLSPACSSFDAYQNYAKRGEHFCELVKSYI